MLLSKAASAAAVLAISEWQTYRLLVMDEDGGNSGQIYKARGRDSNCKPEPRYPEGCGRTGQD
jgi:hypothetical protein